jgi:protein-L-isoaspartate(D-aspartate) O-methyltransferase
MKTGASTKAMVRDQVVGRRIRSRHVIGALLRVDRRIFVPAGSAAQALGDHPVSIACGQTVSQPYMVALMLDALQVRRGMSVLEVGSGSGYVLALLGAMGAQPCGVEWHEELARRIPDRLSAARCGAAAVRCGDGGLGWLEKAPFDRILVSAACPRVPPPLLQQLAPEGILVAPVDAPGGGAQVLLRMTKAHDGVEVEDLGGCVFVPLVGRFGRQDER